MLIDASLSNQLDSNSCWRVHAELQKASNSTNNLLDLNMEISFAQMILCVFFCQYIYNMKYKNWEQLLTVPFSFLSLDSATMILHNI